LELVSIGIVFTYSLDEFFVAKWLYIRLLLKKGLLLLKREKNFIKIIENFLILKFINIG
jgi:hypothetical protein